MKRKPADVLTFTPGNAQLEAKLRKLENRVEAKSRVAADTPDRLRTRRDGMRLSRKNLRLPEDVVERLEQLAYDERASAADLVTEALGLLFRDRARKAK